MTDSFGSQIGISEGIGLWFTSPQGRKFSAGILGVWPVGKENSCGAAFSPKEKSTSVFTKNCPVWSHSSIDRLGAKMLNLHKNAHGIREENQLPKSLISQRGQADLNPKAPDLGVGILCHLPSRADLGVLRTPTLLLSAPQFPASYLTWDFSITEPLENLITNRLLSPCNVCAYCGLWYVQGKSPLVATYTYPSATLMTLVTLGILVPLPFK